MNYQDTRWLTYRQAQALGGHVRKGEQSTRIVFWKPVTRDKPDNESIEDLMKQDTYWLARLYRIFNVEQTEGCKLKPLPEAPVEIPDPIEQAEAIIRNMPNPPGIDTYALANQAPHYAPRTDQVRVPTKDRYQVPGRWYNTMFHELTHSTGHPDRLHRFDVGQGKEDLHRFGLEELVASMGAAMLSRRAAIDQENLEQNAAYIKHWRDTIAADKSIVLRAAGKAQKAVDHILNVPKDDPNASRTAYGSPLADGSET